MHHLQVGNSTTNSIHKEPCFLNTDYGANENFKLPSSFLLFMSQLLCLILEIRKAATAKTSVKEPPCLCEFILKWFIIWVLGNQLIFVQVGETCCFICNHFEEGQWSLKGSCKDTFTCFWNWVLSLPVKLPKCKSSQIGPRDWAVHRVAFNTFG